MTDYIARAKKTKATKIEQAGGYDQYIAGMRMIGAKGGRAGTDKSNKRKGMGSATKEQRQEWGRQGGQKSKRNRKLADTEIAYERIEGDTY